MFTKEQVLGLQDALGLIQLADKGGGGEAVVTPEDVVDVFLRYYRTLNILSSFNNRVRVHVAGTSSSSAVFYRAPFGSKCSRSRLPLKYVHALYKYLVPLILIH